MQIALHYPHEGGSRYAGLQTKARHLKCEPDSLVASSFPGLPCPTANVPDAYRYPMAIWRILHGSREQGFYGPLQISYTQIESFARRKRIELSEWEVDTVLAIDQGWALQNDIEKKGSSKK